MKELGKDPTDEELRGNNLLLKVKVLII